MKRTALLMLVSLLAACSPGGEAEKISKAELIKDFNDPSSVQFRNVVTYSPDPGIYATCGELNAKNSFGAYTGFKKFVAVTENTDKEPYYLYGYLDDNPSGRPVDTSVCQNKK